MIRKIMSREEIQKKSERRNRIIVVILGLIMLFSSAGYFASDYASGKSQTIKYKDITFKQNDYGYWAFELNGQKYVTKFNPEQTLNVSITTEKALGEYRDVALYFQTQSSKDYSDEARVEILNNIGDSILKNSFACLDEACLENYAIKNCSANNIVLFTKTNSSVVSSKDKCVTLEYKEGEAELVADAFIYRILGVQ